MVFPTTLRIRCGALSLAFPEAAQEAGRNNWDGSDSECLCGKELADLTSAFLLPMTILRHNNLFYTTEKLATLHLWYCGQLGKVSNAFPPSLPHFLSQHILSALGWYSSIKHYGDKTLPQALFSRDHELKKKKKKGTGRPSVWLWSWNACCWETILHKSLTEDMALLGQRKRTMSSASIHETLSG